MASVRASLALLGLIALLGCSKGDYFATKFTPESGAAEHARADAVAVADAPPAAGDKLGRLVAEGTTIMSEGDCRGQLTRAAAEHGGNVLVPLVTRPRTAFRGPLCSGDVYFVPGAPQAAAATTPAPASAEAPPGAAATTAP